jgi:succinyl-CoA synthetase beta subunit
MRLVEFEGKCLLRNAGLPVPASFVWEEGTAVPAGRWVAKAQVLAGGRGKRGLILAADADGIGAEVRTVQERMTSLGHDPLVLVEQSVSAEVEYYLAWRIDDLRQAPVLMASPKGGVEIESNPDSIREFAAPYAGPVSPVAMLGFFREAGVEVRHLGALCRFAAASLALFRARDLELLEINPLGGLASGQVVAMDAKVIVNDNALFRQGEWQDSQSLRMERAEQPDIERRAQEVGLTFVDMEGDVALYSSGAGLGMALLDLLGDAGLKPANFVDVSGGSGTDVFRSIGEFVFERAERDDVRAILMFFTLTATSLKACVDSLIAMLDSTPPPKPLVVGLIAAGAAEKDMTLAEARTALEARGYVVESELADAVNSVQRLLSAA